MVEGRVMAENSDIIFSFPIPSYYFGNLAVAQSKIGERVEQLETPK